MSKAEQAVTLWAPRSPGYAFALHFCTFGLYTCFWMVGVVRELRDLKIADAKPLYWFFVPLLVLVQPIALSRLVGFVRQAEARQGLSAWQDGAWLWVVAVMSIGVLFSLHSIIALPSWSVLVGLLFWAGLYAYLEARLNRIKMVLSGVTFRSPLRGYRAPEWLTVVPLLPAVTGLLLYASLRGFLITDIAPLETGTVFLDPAERFQFPVAAEGWVQIVPGTYGDADALMEMRGPVEDAFAIIYSYRDEMLDDLAHDRRNTLYGNLRAAQCREHRQFVASGLSVMSHLVCTGRDMGYRAIWTTVIMETEAGLYEIIGYLAAPRHSYERHKDGLLEMVKGFEAL